MSWNQYRHRIRALAAAATAALACSVVGMGSAGAVTDVAEVGWWTRSPVSSAPDGGFAAGAAPDGVTAVAAVRVDVGGGVDTLVLEVHPTRDAVALASLEVCTTPDTWAAVAGGPLDDAPLTACEGDTVPFAPAGDGWRADVSSLVDGATGSVSLGVVPTAGSGTVPFEVAFEPPAVRSTGAAAPAPTPAPRPAPTPSPSPAPSPAPSASPSIAPVPAPPPVRVGGAATPPPTVAPTTPPAPTEAEVPPAATDDDGAASTIDLATSGVLDDVADVGAPRWGEAVVLVLIGFGVGAAVYAVSRASASRSARGGAAAPA